MNTIQKYLGVLALVAVLIAALAFIFLGTGEAVRAEPNPFGVSINLSEQTVLKLLSKFWPELVSEEQLGGQSTTNSGFIINEDGTDDDTRIESDGLTNAFVVDAGLNSVGVGSTTPWALFSVESSGDFLTSPLIPIFAIGDYGTTTALFQVDGNGFVGIASNTPVDTFSVAGDAFLSSSATTTVVIHSDGQSTGGCLELMGPSSTTYRAYLVSTTTIDFTAQNVIWQIEAGTCQ